MSLPVLVSTQCPSLARSPRGGVAATGFVLGSVLASGGCFASSGVSWPVGTVLILPLRCPDDVYDQSAPPGGGAVVVRDTVEGAPPVTRRERTLCFLAD